MTTAIAEKPKSKPKKKANSKPSPEFMWACASKIESFLANMDYRIIERSYKAKNGETFDLVAKDGPMLVFVKFACTEGDTLPKERMTENKRAKFEKAVTSYFSEREERHEGLIRFDIVSACRVNLMQILIRHHQNVLGGGSDD